MSSKDALDHWRTMLRHRLFSISRNWQCLGLPTRPPPLAPAVSGISLSDEPATRGRCFYRQHSSHDIGAQTEVQALDLGSDSSRGHVESSSDDPTPGVEFDVRSHGYTGIAPELHC